MQERAPSPAPGTQGAWPEGAHPAISTDLLATQSVHETKPVFAFSPDTNSNFH